MKNKSLVNIIILLMILVAIIIIAFVAKNGLGQQRTVPQSNITYQSFADFSGGINTADFVGDIADNELQSAQNLIYVSKNLKARAGYTIFDTTVTGTSTASNRLVKGLTRQYLRDGTKKVYAACSTKVWVSNAGETDFSALTGTIDSNYYVEFLTYRDTNFLVDGGTFQKIVGTTLRRANVVDSGNVQLVAQFSRNEINDTLYFNSEKSIPFQMRSWAAKTDEWADKDPNTGSVGRRSEDVITRILLLADFNSVLQDGDSIQKCLCSLNVSSGSTQETLLFRRNIAPIQENNYSVGSPADAGYNLDTATMITAGGWIDLNCSTYVDSIVNEGKPNYGFTLRQNDEATKNSGRAISLNRFGADTTLSAFIKVIRLTKLKNLPLKPNVFRDTTKAGTWTRQFGENGLTGYFVEFPEFGTTSNDYVRVITGNRGDSLFFTPRLSTSAIVGKAYRIVALPSSQEKAYPKGADTLENQIDSVTVESFADSTRRVWIGNHTNIGLNIFRGETYFLKVVSGKGIGDYQILNNVSIVSPANDYLIIQNSQIQLFDTTSRFEIYRRVFPSPEHFAINKSRFYFSDTLHFGRIWYSEVNKPGAVGVFNFYDLGGDPAEGKITYLGGLYVSNYNDPQSPLVAGKEEAVYLFFGDNPSTDFPRRVIANLGIASAKGVVLSEKEMFFNNSRGRFYRFDGQNIEWINRKIEDQLTDSLTNKVAGFLLDRIIYWNVPKANQCYAYHIDRNVWTGVHSFGFSVASVQNLYKDSIPVIMADFSKGKIYNYGKAVSDLGTNVPIVLQSKSYDLGKPDITKHLMEFVLNWKVQTSAPDVIFYAGDNPLPSVSTDSIRFGTIVTGNRSDKKYLTGASWGRNFSFKIKTSGAGDFKISSMSIGMELVPTYGFGN